MPTNLRPPNRAVVTFAVVCFILIWTSYSVAQTSGLVAAYSFNEGSGSTVSDLSGNNITGTVVGTTWNNQGKFGNALSFNGSSSFVDLGNPAILQMTGSMTLEAWVKAAANPPDDGQIIAKSNGTGWEFKTSPDTGPRTFGVQVTRSAGSNAQRYSTTVPSLNTWYHVASVYDASARKLDIYVNGALNNGILQGSLSSSQVNQSVNVNIGRRSGGFYFNGLIDEVRIYNRALSQSEIQTDMNTPLGGAGPADTQPPTSPANVIATAASGSAINLNWTPSTDNVGVTGYLVERCQGTGCSNFAQIGTASGTAYNDSGLTNATSYSYRVRAKDAAANLSGYSNVASATTPDTQPPAVPSGLFATAIGGSQINLGWNASTDNVGVTGYRVERCQGAGCTTFVQIGTSTSTSFSDTGLTNATSYSYRVRAGDAAGNLSGFSNVSSATTLDTQPPTSPSGLTATPAGGSQINLGWAAATDNVGVTQYLVERCQGPGCATFAQVGTSATTTFSDTGLAPNTSYSYRIRAADAAGNLSPYSNVANAATQNSDTQAPTAPGNLTATPAGGSQINLAWTASTDNVGVASYLIDRCQGSGCSNFVQVATSTSATYNNTGLAPGTSYSYRVRATDAAGNLSTYSNIANATTGVASTITFVQSNYADPQSSPSSVTVKYNAAQVAGDLNVVAVGWNDSTRSVSSVTDSGGNTYQRAVGPTILTGALSQSVYYAKNIRAAAAGANTVTVAFSGGAAFPDIRILEYRGADLANPVDVTAAGAGSGGINNSGSVTTTNATDLLFGANMVTGSTTAPGTGFTQRILTSPDSDSAEDRMVTAVGSYNATAIGGGQWIMQMVAFRTPTGAPDTQPPTAPSNLTATAVSANQINLTWTASTDNVAVAGYLIERCTGTGCSNFAQIANTTATIYSDLALAASTSYTYRVRATDGAGNLGSYSNLASATTATADTQPPTVPSNLAADAVSASRVNLAWTASSDNVGVAGYVIYRNSSSVGTSASTLYSDTGLSPNTAYTYTVSAFDAAGNASSQSPAASVTTPAGTSAPVFPLRAAAGGRYLVDQNNVPTLLIGDSPHSLFVNLNAPDLETYLADRQTHGFNILWVQGLCSHYITNCRSDLSTYDGIKPFTSGSNETNYDVSTPNPAYWSRVDNYVNAAASHNITILFDTWETAVLMPMARANGNGKMYNFGVFLGNRYRDFPNVIWITGNDFQTWTDPTDNTLMMNLMAGIASVDTSHLQTTQLNYNASGSLDDPLLTPYTALAGAYDYYCSYGETLSQYNHSSPVPVFFEEGFYEYNYRGTIRYLRTQAWWAALAGATAGQMYGSENTSPFMPGWQNYLNTVGVAEYGYLNSLLKSMNWFALVPDQTHAVVIAGYGTLDAGDTFNCIDTNNYVTTSYLTDGTVSLSYSPQGATFIVDLSKFRGAVTARWYDPARGNFATIPGSPFVNSGNQSFSTPGSNAAGDPDWVLMLTAP